MSKLIGQLNWRSQTEQAIAVSKQTYIALGTALIAAASETIDACPIEGFNPLVLNEILNLKEKGLQTVVLLALGYRNDAIDFLANATNLENLKKKYLYKWYNKKGYLKFIK